MKDAAILERVLDPGQGDLPADVAQYLLKLGFPPADHERYAQLAARAQEGKLSPAEEAELDDYLSVNTLLAILQSKARLSLRQRHSAA